MPIGQSGSKPDAIAPRAADQTLGMALMSAVFNANTVTLVRGTGAISVERSFVGHYLVTFERDVRDCTFVVSVGDTTSHLQRNGFANAMPFGNLNPPAARVHTRDAGGALVDTLPFHLIVFCAR